MGWQDDEVVPLADKMAVRKATKPWKDDEVVAAPKPSAGHTAKVGISQFLGGLVKSAIGGQDRPGLADMIVSEARGTPLPEAGAGTRSIDAQVTQPQTTGEKYLASAANAAGGSLIGPGGPVRALATGAVSGLASEGAGQATATEGNPEGDPIAKILAALVGGGVASLPRSGAMATPGIVKGVRSTIEAAGMPALRDADARAQEAATTLGTRVLPTQGLANPTPAQGVTARLAQDPATAGQVHQILNAQPAAGMTQVRRLIDDVGAKRNGVPVAPGQGEANAVRDAAIREVAERPAAVAGAVSNPAFRAGQRENIPFWSRGPAVDSLVAARDNMNVLPTSDAGRAFNNRLARLTDENGDLRGSPTELYNFRKELSKLAAAGLKDSATGADITKAVGYRNLVGALDRVLAEHAPNLTRANELYARSMRVNADPIRQSALGTTLPKGSDAANTPGNWGQLNTILANPEKYSPADVTSAARTLSRSDPQAFPNLLRQHLESKLDPLATEGRNASTGEIAKGMFGPSGSRQRENTLTAIAESARAQGRDPAAARRGAEALADALEVVSHDRGGVGALTEAAGRAIIGGVGLRGPWVTTKGLGTGGQSLDAPAVLEALTAPDAMDRLAKIANFSLAANRVKAALRTATSAKVRGNDDE